jgi:hypothetical protein
MGWLHVIGDAHILYSLWVTFGQVKLWRGKVTCKRHQLGCGKTAKFPKFTRGQKVYRWKGRYFVYYNHSDSYPSHFGLQVINEIPRGAVQRVAKEYLDEELKDFELGAKASWCVIDQQPANDMLIEWVYEIDLDNFVFHRCSTPLPIG